MEIPIFVKWNIPTETAPDGHNIVLPPHSRWLLFLNKQDFYTQHPRCTHNPTFHVATVQSNSCQSRSLKMSNILPCLKTNWLIDQKYKVVHLNAIHAMG